mgnify:CR=1 FL=1
MMLHRDGAFVLFAEGQLEVENRNDGTQLRGEIELIEVDGEVLKVKLKWCAEVVRRSWVESEVLNFEFDTHGWTDYRNHAGCIDLYDPSGTSVVFFDKTHSLNLEFEQVER